ncbi:SHOCT domain-containing protein [Calidifontibacillus oryziterrae]
MNGKNMKNGSHIDILKERLSRGQITEDEFDQIKQKSY